MVLQHWSWQPPFSVVHSFTSVGRKHTAVSKEWVLATLPGYLRTIAYDPDVTKWESYGEVQLRTLKATTGAVTPSYGAVPPNSTKSGNGGISPPPSVQGKLQSPPSSSRRLYQTRQLPTGVQQDQEQSLYCHFHQAHSCIRLLLAVTAEVRNLWKLVVF